MVRETKSPSRVSFLIILTSLNVKFKKLCLCGQIYIIIFIYFILFYLIIYKHVNIIIIVVFYIICDNLTYLKRGKLVSESPSHLAPFLNNHTIRISR